MLMDQLAQVLAPADPQPLVRAPEVFEYRDGQPIRLHLEYVAVDLPKDVCVLWSVGESPGLGGETNHGSVRETHVAVLQSSILNLRPCFVLVGQQNATVREACVFFIPHAIP